MNAPRKRKRPAATGRGFRSTRLDYGHEDNRSARVPHGWRDRLALLDVASYYAARVAELGRPNGDGWAACRCPVHEDSHASASVNLRHGGFRCHGCGAKHDLIGLHMRITGKLFAEAVADLLRGGR